MFQYNINCAPWFFTNTSQIEKQKFHDALKSHHRVYLKTLKKNPNIQCATPFGETPLTCGEMAILWFRRSQS